MNSDLSGLFPIVNGVKLGCVLAPTPHRRSLTKTALYTFTTMLTAVCLASVDCTLTKKKKQTWASALWSPLRWRGCPLRLYGESPAAPNFILYRGCSALRTRGHLKEVFHQPALVENCRSPHVTIAGTELKAVHQFTYLGYTVISDVKIDREVDNRLAKENSAFGRLYNRTASIWRNALSSASIESSHSTPCCMALSHTEITYDSFSAFISALFAPFTGVSTSLIRQKTPA